MSTLPTLHPVPIRVALADDNLLVREGLEKILEEEPEIEVVASCEDLPSLLKAVETESPNVVMTDIRMPPSECDEGIRIATLLHRTHPEIGVIILSQYDDPEHVLALLEHGLEGRGYMLKERIHDRGQISDAIGAVAQGGSVIDPRIVDVLVGARMRGETSPLETLSPRELEVLAEVSQGKSNSAIAESLTITKGAVEKHIISIFLKLGLSNAQDVSKRVKAALLFLAEEGEHQAPDDSSGSP